MGEIYLFCLSGFTNELDACLLKIYNVLRVILFGEMFSV